MAGGGIALREAIITAPVLIDAELAAARVAGWIAEQPQAVALEALIAAHPIVKTLLESVSESSPHLWELVTRDAQRLLRLMVSEPEPHLAALLAAHGEAVADTQDFDDASRHLRHMKAEASLLIALADIGGVWPIMRCARALTALADAAVGAAVHFLLAEAARAGKLSPPDPASPDVGSGYIVLALGKMGGFELNYSSDIDLIVFYDPDAPALAADTEPGRLFVRLTQRLVKLLQARTADGYVFRTDLRLRPDPSSTPIAVSKAAALSYYESVGQNWERAAMIKARPCAGDIAAGEALLKDLVALRMAQISRLTPRSLTCRP